MIMDDEEAALRDLTVRTLTAFATRNIEGVNRLLEEWKQRDLHDLLTACAIVSLQMRSIGKLGPRGLEAELHIDGPVPIDDSPPGIRTGARMVTAGLNGDVTAVGDLVHAFVVEMGGVEHSERMRECQQLFETVFELCAQGCIAMFEQEQRQRWELN